MDDSVTGGFWMAGPRVPEEPGPFETTDDFSPIFDASWDFLKDGGAKVGLFGMPMALVDLCWPVTPPPEAFIDEAVLIIDADFPVPTEPTTWGRIKALYRQ